MQMTSKAQSTRPSVVAQLGAHREHTGPSLTQFWPLKKPTTATSHMKCDRFVVVIPQTEQVNGRDMNDA
jgi:hypothetical protein